MIKSKKTNTIHFVTNSELDKALNEIKKQKYFNASNSKMIRDLLFLGIDSLKNDNNKNIVLKKDNTISTSFDFKILREKMGLSPEAVATFADIPEETYIAIENGELQPTKEILSILSDIFSTSIN